ncbi:MAG: hypothetical protein QCH31_11160 [Methanolobus sp.]|nr:hypothetical protein [Methanolobus sp.]
MRSQDKVAEQKILDGVWERTWSVYGKASSISEGWAEGFQARSLTLVRDPAWDEASFNVVASTDTAGLSKRFKRKINLNFDDIELLSLLLNCIL